MSRILIYLTLLKNECSLIGNRLLTGYYDLSSASINKLEYLLMNPKFVNQLLFLSKLT